MKPNSYTICNTSILIKIRDQLHSSCTYHKFDKEKWKDISIWIFIFTVYMMVPVSTSANYHIPFNMSYHIERFRLYPSVWHNNIICHNYILLFAMITTLLYSWWSGESPWCSYYAGRHVFGASWFCSGLTCSVIYDIMSYFAQYSKFINHTYERKDFTTRLFVPRAFRPSTASSS